MIWSAFGNSIAFTMVRTTSSMFSIGPTSCVISSNWLPLAMIAAGVAHYSRGCKALSLGMATQIAQR